MSPLAFGMGKSRGSAFDFAIFYSDKLQFYWNWTDGKDFDLRAEFIRPTQLAGVSSGSWKDITYYRWWWFTGLYEMGWR